MKDDEEVAEVDGEQAKLIKEDLPAYKVLGDRKYSHCGFLKIMVPKNVSEGDNCCMCLPLLICCGNLLEKNEKIKNISSKC